MSGTIKTFDQISDRDESSSGSKAYNCARLRRAGIPVPDGLVLTTRATDSEIVDIASHPWFQAQPADARFAVRSSGIGEDGHGQSFAGIHETFLNITRQGVAKAAAACRASARSDRALAYRRAKKLDTTHIETAVLVQRMVDAETSGVGFTTNPVTGSTSEIVINAGWGLGEALVSGQIEPDEFGVRKSDGEILWERLGEKDGPTPSACLSRERVQQLGRLLVAIERHYDAPQDVEWCHDGRAFWIVQSRPITGAATDAGAETEWTRANLAEVLPELTSPQALEAFEELLNRAERLYMGRLMGPEAKLGPICKIFHGRLYFNISQMRHVCALAGVSPAAMLKSMGHPGGVQASDEAIPHAPMADRLASVPDLIRIGWQHFRIDRIMRDHEVSIRDYLAEFDARPPESLSDAEMWSAFESWREESPRKMRTILLLAGVTFQERPVQRFCERVGFQYEQLVYPQLATGERSVSAQQAYDLVELAHTARQDPIVMQSLTGDLPTLAELRRSLSGTRFLDEFERFLSTYGHRGLYESDWALPRYTEDPTPLLHALRAHLQNPPDAEASNTADVQAREAEEAWAAFERRLTPGQKKRALPRLRRSVQRIKQYSVWREKVRFDMMRVLARIRERHLTLAQRFVERGWIDGRDEYFLIKLSEVGSVIAGTRDPSTLRSIVTERSAERARQRTLTLPLLMRESELPRLIRAGDMSGGPGDERRLAGHPVSTGRVEAEVVVVHDPADFGRMKRGAILVARATDPSWTPLFTLASGIIVEVGGVLSHASTVAREYGLPALANVRQATRRLKTGERVRLDAIDGFVERLDAASS
jgi:pyruvate,water dikinase